MNRPRKIIIHKIRHKYRLVVLKEGSLEEKASFKLSRVNLVMLISSFFVISSLLIFLLVAFTPLKLYIPGYADYDTRKTIILLTLKTDSLESQLLIREKYINNIRRVLTGDVNDYSKSDNIKLDSATANNKSIPDNPSKEEERLRKEIEKQDKNTVLYQEATAENNKGLI